MIKINRGIKKFELKEALFCILGVNSLVILVLNNLLNFLKGEFSFQKDD
jgi:hypothetical protein